MYRERLEQIIARILEDMEGLPEGAELEEMRRLLEQMLQIAALRLDLDTE